jgi:hypothetical protein
MGSMLNKSRRQEKTGAKRLGGTVNPGSGNGWMRKNDVRTPDLSIEYKYTEKKSFILRLADLLLAEKHALLDGRTMVFGISFADEDFVVMRESDFHAVYRGETSWR